MERRFLGNGGNIPFEAKQNKASPSPLFPRESAITGTGIHFRLIAFTGGEKAELCLGRATTYVRTLLLNSREGIAFLAFFRNLPALADLAGQL
jgi:hypothetical protein